MKDKTKMWKWILVGTITGFFMTVPLLFFISYLSYTFCFDKSPCINKVFYFPIWQRLEGIDGLGGLAYGIPLFLTHSIILGGVVGYIIWKLKNKNKGGKR